MARLDPLVRDALFVLAGSLVLPSILVLAARTRASTADRVRAWFCFWTGQLALPLALVVGGALQLAREWAARRALVAAIACGVTMAFVALLTTVTLARVFALGFVALTPTARGRLHRCAELVLHRAALTGLAAVVASFLPMVVWLPGRWDGAIYLVLVVSPVLVASLCAVVLAAVLRRAR